MRKLPEEQNSEQHRGAEAEVTAGRDPPGHRRQCAGDRADQDACRAAHLQRCVRAYIKDGGAQGQNGNGHPHARGEVDDAERRQRAGEDECLERLEPTIGQRPMSRPLHPRVDITLDVLVQRQRPAGRQERAEQQVREADIIRRSGERHEIPDERGREDHDQHTRLRERDEVGYEPVSISRQRRDDHFDLPTHRPTTYTTVKTTTHTPSTKCQYQDTSSTRSAWTALSAPENAKATHRLSMTSPTITCDACRPTSG